MTTPSNSSPQPRRLSPSQQAVADGFVRILQRRTGKNYIIVPRPKSQRGRRHGETT